MIPENCTEQGKVGTAFWSAPSPANRTFCALAHKGRRCDKGAGTVQHAPLFLPPASIIRVVEQWSLGTTETMQVGPRVIACTLCREVINYS